MLPVAVFTQLHKVLQHQFCATAFVIRSHVANYRFFTAAKIDIRVLLFGRFDSTALAMKKNIAHSSSILYILLVYMCNFAAELYAFPLKSKSESI